MKSVVNQKSEVVYDISVHPVSLADGLTEICGFNQRRQAQAGMGFTLPVLALKRMAVLLAAT